MNLLITDVCNRSCAYCFAASQIVLAEAEAGRPTRFITRDNFDLYLRFLLRSGEKSLKLLGGEPTLHPQFPDLVRAGVDAGLSVSVFTNGIWPRLVREFVSDFRDDRLTFVFNINEPQYKNERELEREAACLEVAGPQAGLGFNIWHEEFDMRFLVRLVDRYGLRREVRLGLAAPIVGGENAFLALESFPRIGRRLVRQLLELEEHDVLGSFDCGFPLCMFDQADLGSLVTATTGFASLCGPVIDVGPDLTVWPCFPLSQQFNINLLDFHDREELDNYYTKKLAPLRSLGTFDECKECKYLRRGQCCGGCIARSLRDWANQGDPRLLEKLDHIH